MIPAIMLSLTLAQPADTWVFEELIHNNGSRFQGLVLSETAQGVKFQVVTRLPGRPTVTLTTIFSKSEYAKINRLDEADRTRLKTRLDNLDATKNGERDRLESLKLISAEWLGKADSAKRYDSDHFTLISNAPEEITGRAAVRLEQLFAAFRRYLPPQTTTAKPTTIFLTVTPEEYVSLLGPGAPRLLNPAVYDPVKNRIICGSNLRQLGEQLNGSRLHHQRQFLAIEQYKADILKLYKDQKSEQNRYLSLANSQRQTILAAEAANDRAFDTATKQLFAVLYHEAFHAYAHSYAFPDRELPRWLNEGLAQIFETAVVEAGELRVGHAEPERLKTVREWIKADGGEFLSIADLVKTQPSGFVAKHTDAKAASERAYAASWAAAHYLLFARNAIGNERFAKYLVDLKAGRNANDSLEQWIDQSPSEFDREWRDYLTRLKSDGTLEKMK
jgi:hypothetical protein